MDPSQNPNVFHATTIVSVRRNGKVVIGGDGRYYWYVPVESTDTTQANRMALMADDGLARAIVPSHTVGDGDTVFALATGRHTGAVNITVIGALAADALAVDDADRAIAAARAAPRGAVGDAAPFGRRLLKRRVSASGFKEEVAPESAAAQQEGKWCSGTNIVFFPGGAPGGPFETVVYNGAVQAAAS